MGSQIINYPFDRKNISCGILHIGVGNFHRAHQQYYTNLLLENKSQQNWGICGAMLLPSDEKLYHSLTEQDSKYTLTVCGRDGKNLVYQIGSLIELIWAVKQPENLINKIADPAIKIITLTITEGGYNIDKASNQFKLDSPTIKHDLENPKQPQTVFGYIAEGLRKRKADSNSPITILSCDNLQHNGDTAQRAFLSFIKAQDETLYEWVKENVSFPNSMVDRITPATHPTDIERLNKMNGVNDKAPVYCEDFIQWVIEDKFIAGRPEWERVGVEFTDNVAPYENMKLSLLNASHTLLSYPSFLCGYRKVDEAMQDKKIVKLVKTFMDVDITPYVPAPNNTNLSEYKQTLIERFANHSVSDQVARLCSDGISKFPVYIMPNLIKMIADNANCIRLAFLFASYRHYLKYRTDDKGSTFDITEPWLTDKDLELINSANPLDFLELSAFESTDLSSTTNFTELYSEMVTQIKEKGTMQTLESII